MFEHAVDQRLLLLIDRFASEPFIADRFYIAGGTALALQLGHRKSVDIDLCSQEPFDIERIVQTVTGMGGAVSLAEKGTAHTIIDEIRVSFLEYPYQLLEELLRFRSIKMATISDIACMKTVAVSQRGDKKDFYDMYEILKTVTPQELKNLYLQKYTAVRVNCYHTLKSFFYFEEADAQPDPISINGTTWDEVKLFFTEHEPKLTKELLC
jgi:predicted nucleotidyltransferase component of viral defense system